MMRIMISGGAGFIGSNFVRYMLSKHRDVEIINLDLLTYCGRLENLHDVKNYVNYKFIQGSIQERKIIEKILNEGIDLIANFAAETHVDRSIVKADSFILTDIYGTYILLDEARKHDVHRFVQISTDEVYGSIERGSFRETDTMNPSSPYSASKAAGDLMCQAFHKTYGFNVVIARSSNNFGPYQHPEKFVPKVITRALRDDTVPLYGDGKQQRDWIYVTDNCRALDLIIQKGKAGEIYNIASGEEHTNIEIAKLILRILDKPESLIRFVADRPGHDQRYSLDTAKIRALGWKMDYEFEEALKETIKWYKTHEKWWVSLFKDEYVRLDTPWLDAQPHIGT